MWASAVACVALAVSGLLTPTRLVCAATLVILLLVCLQHSAPEKKDDPAAARGASHVPRVRGKLPLNIDVLLAWLHHADEDVGRMFYDLSQQYGPTFNTCVLGEDQILSCDPAVFDAVMNDQFSSFPKGQYRIRRSGLWTLILGCQDPNSATAPKVYWGTASSTPMESSESSLQHRSADS